MENLGKDGTSLDSSSAPSADSSPAPSAASKEYMVPDVIITHRLRDRELLRKRRAEAMEKDSTQWILRVQKTPQQRRGRGARRGRGRQPEAKVILVPKPTVDRQPELQEEAEPAHPEPAPPEPVHSEPAPPEPVHPEPAPPEPVYPEPALLEPVHPEPALLEPVHPEPALLEPVYQEQLPVMTIQNSVSGVQPVAEEGEPAARSLDPAGEEEAVKPAEAEILEAFNTPVENDQQDNEFNPRIPY